MKIIIWGHKNNGHTHGYIHSSYFKAFKYMGYDTYWFDNNEDVSGFNFNNCIFLTEDQAQSNIPINKTCKYILHHTKLDKYIDSNLNFINLANYLKYCNSGIDEIYNKGNTLEKAGECCFWDKKTKTLHQPWATDLIPAEIDLNNALQCDESLNDIYYIGLSHENSGNLGLFSDAARAHGKKFIITRGQSDSSNMELIRKSLISVDIRGDWHLECGYLPCRVFKNISYGRLTGTNSENVKKIMGDHVVYEPNPLELFNKMIEAERLSSLNDIKASMDYVKTHHTYINRINNLLKFI
jgi:hypothetical protein